MYERSKKEGLQGVVEDIKADAKEHAKDIQGNVKA